MITPPNMAREIDRPSFDGTSRSSLKDIPNGMIRIPKILPMR